MSCEEDAKDLPLYLNSVAALPCETLFSTMQLFICTSDICFVKNAELKGKCGLQIYI